MRLDIGRWSTSPPQTALELIPCRSVRPTETYFQAGHLLLDALIRSLPQRLPAQLFPASQHGYHGLPAAAGGRLR